ncbi:MAG: RHS repeat-associated core domain-containing protein [Bacteroidales bacterium]|nr:RHS repeat-associated core domain-containing protein [Bacteroidales bacterium]
MATTISAYQIHCSFSGKEKDSETGYYYFGARYYNSDLSLWLSVDPMADKYPSLSPYNYCAWNPMRIIDPNGMDLDSTSVPQKVWSLVTPNSDCYNAELAGVFNQLANDRTTIFKFDEWSSPKITGSSIIYGNFTMESSIIGQKDVTIVGFYWNNDNSSVAPERYMCEEIYHAKQFLDGEFGFARSTSSMSWGARGLDLIDEQEAHLWADRVSGSPNSWTQDAIKYYKLDKRLPGDRRNVTDYHMKYDGEQRTSPPKYDETGVFKDGYRSYRKPRN